jgi:secreted PhoX family phosphatase
MSIKKKNGLLILLLAAAVILSGLALFGCNDDPTTISSVEFVGMPAPSTDQERSSVYTTAKVIVSYTDGTSKEFPLAFNALFYNTDKVGNNPYEAGRLYDINGAALLDDFGGPMIAETPDANSLLQITGAPSTGKGGNPLYLVTHFEYDWLLSDGSKADGDHPMPMTMSLTTIDQNTTNGALMAVNQRNINMSAIYGLWTPCAGSQTPWNTHLGSEEDYDADARAIEAGTKTTLANMDKYYFKLTGAAKPYNYGIIPEVTVKADGSTTVTKHYSMGRGTWEMAKVMPDGKTAFLGDDGTYTMLAMYVADNANDLSSGTLYAAKWNQTGSANGGEATLNWIKLGKATDAEIKTLANSLKFSDIFETSAQPATGFVAVKTNSNSGSAVEYLKLKPGMEKAAAFLETRRYAAYLGATTEFEKMEGIALNIKDNKIYIAMTRISAGMEDKATDPANHIKLSKLLAGAVYELALAVGQKDTTGNSISSDYVAVSMKGMLLGEDIPKDAVGNTANVDKIANPDNIFYSEKMRTLFIGEDSSTLHINNFLWAYNVDTKKLSRILSLPAGAESTGLQTLDNMNGFAYIMSNYQHAGDYSSNIDAALKSRLEPLINKFKAGIGYISGIPGLN